MYGSHIQLTYHGHEKFRTKFGSFCTFLIGAIVLSYAVFNASKLVNPHDALAVYSKLYLPEMHQLYAGTQVKDADGVEFTMKDHPVPLRPAKVFAFGFASDHAVRADMGSFAVKVNGTQLEVVPCRQNTYAIERLNLTEHSALFCLANYSSYELMPGNAHLGVTFEACTGSDECLEAPAVTEWLQGKAFKFVFDQP